MDDYGDAPTYTTQADAYIAELRERLILAEVKLASLSSPCVWMQVSQGRWVTTCGNMVITAEGTPGENGYRACPFCGHPLVEESAALPGEVQP